MPTTDATRRQNWFLLLVIAVLTTAIGLVLGLVIGEFANSRSRQSAEERFTSVRKELADAKSDRSELNSKLAEQQQKLADQQQEIERLRQHSAAIARASEEGISPERIVRLKDRIAELMEEKEKLRKQLESVESSKEARGPEPAVAGRQSDSAIHDGQGGLTITNTTIKSEGFGMTRVVGEVTNNTSRRYSATLIATFYGKDGGIVGTAGGAINGIEPGQTKTFELMSTDNLGKAAKYKVAVDTLLPF